MIWGSFFAFVSAIGYSSAASIAWVTEVNVPSTSDGGKTVTSRTVTQGTLKEKSDYLYDSYGNIIQETQYADPGNVNTAKTTKYSYTDAVRGAAFNGAYLTRKWVENVKDKDGTLVAARSGNAAGTVDERYEYNYFGKVAKQYDGTGNATTFLYDAKDRITKVTHPDGTFQTSTYRSDSTEVSVIVKDENANSVAYAASGNQTKYVFDDIGNMRFEQLWNAGAFQNVYEFQYDNNNQLLLEKNNVNGATLNYTYFSNGTTNALITKNVLNQVLASDAYTYQFAANSGQNTIVTKTRQGDVSSPESKVIMTFDRLGQLVKNEQPHNGQTYLTTFQYDLMGNKTSEKSARANDENWIETYTQQFEYDYAGRMTKVYSINGDYASTVYDALGRKLKETDFEGNKANVNFTSDYSYDALNRVLRKGIALEDTTLDIPTGRMLTNNGNEYYAYDRNGNVTSYSINNGIISNTTSVRTMQYGYNTKNQLTLTNEIEATKNLYSQYFYDATGNMLRKYTGLSNLLTISGLDQVTESGDSNYSVDKYAFNALGKATQVTDALGQSSSMTYDLSGNLMTIVDRNGNQSAMTYDGLNRLLTQSVTGVNASANVLNTFAYSISGNLKSMTNNQSTSAYTYDDLGRLTKDVTDGAQKDYDYDANGNRKLFKLTTNGTIAINQTYAYDKLNRLTQTLSNGNVEASYQYDTNGNAINVTYANGTSSVLTYNRGGMVKSVANKKAATTLSQFGYDYYADGNLYHKIEGAASTSYTYDKAGRLQQVTHPANEMTSFVYDDYGNRLEQTNSNSSSQVIKNITYQYDKNNRLQTESKIEGTKKTTTRYMFDPNGNTKFKSTVVQEPTQGQWQPLYGLASDELANGDITLFNYNAINQLTGAATSGHQYNYAYNAGGLRTQKTVDGVTTKHVWDGQQLAAETNTANAIQATYIRGNGLINATIGVSAKQYYLHNGHGDVMNLTDVNGNVIKNYNYDEFGNELNPITSDTNPFRYTGEYFDKETGTYYLRARSYDPSIGRFINEDTYQGEITNPLSLNLYIYVYNNPLIYRDPTGHVADFVIDIGFMIYDAVVFVKDPSWENATYLALDTGAAFIPFVTGAGLAAKTANKAAKTTKAVAVTQKASKTITKEAFDSLPKTAQEAAINSGMKVCNCFTAGTKVLTDDGEKPIQEIEVGDMVLSKSDESGEVAYKEVVGLFQKQTDEIYYVHIGDEIIEVTGEHPFWLEGKGWTLVKDLKIGDLLVSNDGTKLAIDKIEKEPQEVTVYNFEVKDFNSYFVSNLGIWVHNCALQNVFKSIKDSPLYPQGFSAAKNGTVKNKVNNTELLEELRGIETGTWNKIYKDGLDANGKKISVHYFQSQSGQVFNVKTKNGWSNSTSQMP